MASYITNMKKTLAGIALFALAFTFAPAGIAFAQTENSDLNACTQFADNGVMGVVNCLKSVFAVLINLMVAASVVVIVWGAFKMIYNEEGRDEAKKTIYYGVIGLFVMISIWGLVNILDNTFKLSRSGPTTMPQILPR